MSIEITMIEERIQESGYRTGQGILQITSMAAQNLTDVIASLTPEEQESVRQFVEFLKHQESSPRPSTFFGAVDEFIDQHPELLRRLAQ